MSFFDNDPPKHLDIGSLTEGKNFNIYTSDNGKKFKYCVFFTLEEKKVLIEKEGIFPRDIQTNSKNVYEEALKKRERARQYIKNNEPDNELTK